MPHMNDVMELLGESKTHLENYVDELSENDCVEDAYFVMELINRIKQMLHEHEALKIGHLGRA